MEPGESQDEPVLKDWLLKRNCAVTPQQFLGFYLFLATISFSVAAVVALSGAWMVLIFSALELVAVGIAFVVYARHAVDYEHIRLQPHRLIVEQMSAQHKTQYEFNPRWVRIELGEQDSSRARYRRPRGMPLEPITLHAAGKTVEIGQHLAQDRRAQFVQDLRAWIRRCS
ncbi:DUF2244 domain-containing protein [Pseudomonas sp.]|uniref:DUF2244 domain-containing protein n=1 Tax=Pseudomonas sp. TaxID=306 RepID=UPI00263A028D|nr:DUF2244 domain-containing protein [Pseudomonas sp.]